MGYNTYMNKTTAKKYLSAIEGSKKRYVTCENLSRVMGIYPEVIAEQLSYFEPMLAMDPSYDLKDLIPAISSYIEEEEAKKEKKDVVKVYKKDLGGYKSVADFLYRKMTINGLVDRNASLSEVDLKALKKLVQQELDEIKSAISLLYPAAITTNFPRRSSISFSRLTCTPRPDTSRCIVLSPFPAILSISSI